MSALVVAATLAAFMRDTVDPIARRKLGGSVTERIYPNMAHTVNDDEVRHIRTILARALADDSTV